MEGEPACPKRQVGDRPGFSVNRGAWREQRQKIFAWLGTLTKLRLWWQQGQALQNSGSLQHFLAIMQLTEKFLY